MDMYNFVYKCRRCGELERGPSTGNETMAIVSLNEAVVTGTANSHAGIPFGLVSSHRCNDGGYGVSDLQGFEFEKVTPTTHK